MYVKVRKTTVIFAPVVRVWASGDTTLSGYNIYNNAGHLYV